MGLAYSPPDKVIHADIDASSAHCLQQGLHAAVQLAGWEIDRAITNGYVYILTSPQDASLQMKVQIQDNAREIWPFRHVIDFRFMDFEEVNLSEAWSLWHGPGRRIRAHITPCQIFTYLPGQAGSANAVMGGIPFVDPNALISTETGCADEDNDLKTTRAWWACADGDGSFRDSWTAARYATLHNNTFVSATPGEGDNARLRLLPVQRPAPFWASMGNANFAYPLILRWIQTEEPLCFDPFVAWSDTHPVKIRGQLWDALWRTQYVTWESPLVFEDLPWFSYSMGEKLGYPPHYYQTGDLYTLYLRDPGITRFDCDVPEPEPETESNYAY